MLCLPSRSDRFASSQRLCPLLFGLVSLVAIHFLPHPTRASEGPESALVVQKLEAYRENVRQLRIQALAQGFISYSEVLTCVYAELPDLSEILQAKRDWRQRYGRDHIYLSNYDALSEAATVSKALPLRNRQLASTIVARYESRDHAIRIADIASDFSIVHESGHALQREALVERCVRRSQSVNFTSFEINFPSYLKRTGVDGRSAKRLRYLTSQDELEVRMQDLNRFYAVAIAGRPILTPHETIEAMATIGLRLEVDSLVSALEAAKAPMADRREVAAILARAKAIPEPARALSCFDDASELLMMQRLTERIDPELWQTLLARLLVETPGHL
ncbi:hypothetical protein [Pelagicoccus sp. SDUM812003]|uniref:hypothetical protein n=1 Tax=Pelagicoccus sp. SDUM812003 TaxID=3041267 RepID=UPI00280CECC7|nr:hypothetical protein [Pelagicoccus sp. SDUM812003]MDQ8204323.1 hypothetical protein [Pelagicoccus sp. SDUM812003]